MFCIDSSLWIKICGLMVPEQAVAIARQGASALGFIGVRSSPRYVTPLQIRAMSQALIAASLSRVERVGVFVNATSAELETAITTGQLTAVQLHGQETPARCQQVRRAYPQLKLIKALRIRSEADLAAVQSYQSSIDAILLDAYHPDRLGGTGETLDWRSLRAFQPAIPWILAGGLTPDNIETALTQLSPQGIDLSSGVELSPGNKCLTQVESLFATLNNLSAGQVAG
ncbi:MAG: phosphoribosylanthranilate isomerase [Cyanobacteria bacterium P01_D01_bin.115]